MKYFISGKVLPERAAVQFSEIAMDMKQHGYLKITCDAGQLNAIFDTPIKDIVSAKLTVEHNAQMIVSALGFSLNRTQKTNLNKQKYLMILCIFLLKTSILGWL